MAYLLLLMLKANIIVWHFKKAQSHSRGQTLGTFTIDNTARHSDFSFNPKRPNVRVEYKNIYVLYIHKHVKELTKIKQK